MCKDVRAKLNFRSSNIILYSADTAITTTATISSTYCYHYYNYTYLTITISKVPFAHLSWNNFLQMIKHVNTSLGKIC